MARKIIREKFIEIINTQLDKKLSPATTIYYQKYLKMGLSEESALESLAYFYEVYLRQNPRHSEDFKEETWLNFLEQIPVTKHEGEYIFDQSDAKRNLRTIQKQYGTMKKNVKRFESELYTIESFLIVLHASFQISSRDAQRIIHVVINRLLDIKNQESTDYSEYTHEDILYMADALEEICNPFVNKELEKFLKPYVNIHDLQCYDYLFKNVFLCMTRVLDSIDFWDKEFGKDGYFRYIKQFMNLDHIMSEGPQFFFNEDTLSKNLK